MSRVPNRPDLNYMRDRIDPAGQFHRMVPPTKPILGGIAPQAALRPAAAPQVPAVVVHGVAVVKAAETLPVRPVGCPQGTFALNLPAGASLQVQPANPARTYLWVENNSGGIVYYATGRPATTADKQIPPGGFYEPWRAPTTGVNLFSAGGGAVVVIQG